MEYLNTNEFLQICKYISGEDGDETFGTELIQRFRRMCYAFENKVYKDGIAASNRANSLQKRLDRIFDKEKEEISLGNVSITKYGSDDIAQCVLLLAKCNGYSISNTKAIYITYLAYCTWLHSRRERLCKDFPQAMPQGPHFWTAAESLKESRNISDEALSRKWNSIRNEDPGLSEMLINTVKEYGRFSENTLKELLCNSEPYKNAHKDNNNGKWNKRIDDGDIFKWKSIQRK